MAAAKKQTAPVFRPDVWYHPMPRRQPLEVKVGENWVGLVVPRLPEFDSYLTTVKDGHIIKAPEVIHLTLIHGIDPKQCDEVAKFVADAHILTDDILVQLSAYAFAPNARAKSESLCVRVISDKISVMQEYLAKKYLPKAPEGRIPLRLTICEYTIGMDSPGEFIKDEYWGESMIYYSNS